MRLRNWETAFHDRVRQVSAGGFHFGRVENLQWAVMAVADITGRDLLAPHMQAGISRQKAADALRKANKGELAAWRALAVEGGLQEVGPKFAQRGDVVELAGGKLGLVALDGRLVWIVRREPEVGLVLGNGRIGDVLRAWRVE